MSKKGSAAVMGQLIFKNVLDVVVGACGFSLIGYPLATGHWMWSAECRLEQWYYLYVFCATASTITSGAVTQRATILSYSIFTFVNSSVVFPVVARVIWAEDGWFSMRNPAADLMAIDFAGTAASGCLHAMALAYCHNTAVSNLPPFCAFV